MAGEAQGANVTFGGDATGAIDAARKAADSVKSSVEGMMASFDKLRGNFELVTKGFAAITAAVAGGKALKEFVQEADAVTKASASLGKSLGISATDASVFRQALDDVGVSSETVEFAGKRVAMALKEGDGKFAALGVKVRDTNGQLRNSRDIMLDVNEKLRGFKEGTDRNIESMKMYGRSYDELAPFINKFTSALEEEDLARAHLTAEDVKGMSASERYALTQQRLRESAEALNLVVGQESVEASKRYSLAKRNLNDVMEGVNRTIGEALIPRLTKMAEFFSSQGPAAVSVMRGVMNAYLAVQDAVGEVAMTLWTELKGVFTTIGNVLVNVFGESSEPMTAMKFFANILSIIKAAAIALRIGIQTAFTVIGANIQGVVSWLGTFAEIGKAALDLDFDAAKEAWKRGFEERAQIVADATARVMEIATKGAADLQAALTSDPTAKGKMTDAKDPKNAPGKTSQPTGDQGAFALTKAQLMGQLAVRKEAIAEALKAVEDQHTKELLSDREFYEKKAALELASLSGERAEKEAELAHLRVEMGKAENAGKEKQNALLAQQAKLKADLLVIDMKEAQVAVQTGRDIEKAERDRAKKLEEIRIDSAKQMIEIDLQGAEEDLKARRAMGLITAQEELQGQSEIITRRYENERAALEARLALAEYDAAERLRIEAQLQQALAKYNEKMKANAIATAQELRKPFMAMASGMQQAFERGLESLFDRTKTLKDKLKAVWVDMATTFIREMVTKPVTAWLFGERTKTVATTVGNEERTASTWLAATESVAAAVWSGMKEIAINAWKVASGVYSAIAAIPYVGPFLAPVMAVAAMGAVMSYAGHLASARGGYDIPAGVNPLTQLHEREMVLPAQHADTIRALGENGGVGDGGGGDIHIHAVDAKSIKRLLMDNGDSLVRSAAKQVRNANSSTRGRKL